MIKKKEILGIERDIKSKSQLLKISIPQLKILKKQKEALERLPIKNDETKKAIEENDQTIKENEQRIKAAKKEIKDLNVKLRKASLEPLKGGKCRTKRKRTKRR